MNSFPFKKILEEEGVRIFATVSAYRDQLSVVVEHLRPKDFLLIHDWSPVHTWGLDWSRVVSQGPREQILFLSNERYTHEARIGSGLASHLINQNAWINFDIIRPMGFPREYRAVINARAKNWKRYALASQVDGLALITQRWNIEHHFGENDDSYLRLDYKFLNDRILDVVEVRNTYCRSNLGLCLSVREGACYASSEMLLCGLPVISTKPEDPQGTLGGREYWYTPHNSVLCDATPEAVRDAVLEVEARIESGDFDREQIRQAHVDESLRLRNVFKRDVLEGRCGLSRAAAENYMKDENLFSTFYRNKHGRCALLVEGFNVSLDDAVAMLGAR